MKRLPTLITAILLALVGVARSSTLTVSNTTVTQAQLAGVDQLQANGGVTLDHLTLSGVQVVLHGSGNHVTYDTVLGSTTIDCTDSCSNSEIRYNRFAGTAGYAVWGYPSDNVVAEYNDVDLSAIVNSGPDGNIQWLHWISNASGLSISHNKIYCANRFRWAIELQSGMKNLKVQGNWIYSPAGGSAMSCAVGGDAKAPFANQGQNVDISGNTLMVDQSPGQNSGIEADGASTSIHDNYVRGFQTSILCSTGGQGSLPLSTANNVLIYTVVAYSTDPTTPWPNSGRVSTGDQLFKVGAPGIPPAPAAPTNVGPGAVPTTQQSVAVVPAIDLGLKATSTASTITWTWAAQTVPATLTLVTPGNGQTLSTTQIAPGTTSYTASGLGANWVVTATLSTAAGQQTLAAQCLAKVGDAQSVGPINTPATPAATTTTPDLATLKAARDAAAQTMTTASKAYQDAQAAYIAALEAAAGKQ